MEFIQTNVLHCLKYPAHCSTYFDALLDLGVRSVISLVTMKLQDKRAFFTPIPSESWPRAAFSLQLIEYWVGSRLYRIGIPPYIFSEKIDLLFPTYSMYRGLLCTLL